MRRWPGLIALTTALAILACDQIPFTVQVPIVITGVHLTAPDSLQTQEFQKRVVDVTEYANYRQYIDFARQITVDSALLRITNHGPSTATLDLRVAEDTTLTPQTLDAALPLASLSLRPDTTRRLRGRNFLNFATLDTLQEVYLPEGLFTLYFQATTEEGAPDLTVDSLVLYVHLEGAK